MLGLGIIIGILIGAAMGSAISGHVAYVEGIQDERRKWYVHAHCHFHKEEDFLPYNHDEDDEEGGEE
jgi:hypothetical protein